MHMSGQAPLCHTEHIVTCHLLVQFSPLQQEPYGGWQLPYVFLRQVPVSVTLFSYRSARGVVACTNFICFDVEC